MLIDEFLKNLSEEVGFKFGTPWRYSDKALGVMIPILKIGDLGERGYVTLEEAKDKGVTFKDTGRIDRVIVESSIGVPIFIRSGVMFKSSGTQPRAVETSVVIIPQEEKKKEEKKEEIPPIPIVTKIEIPVRCIHATKGIRSSEKFSYGGDVPLEVRSVLMSKRGQSETWAAVGHATNRFMSSMTGQAYSSSGSSYRAARLNTNDLVGVMEEVDKFTPNIDDILAKVPLFEDQVGAVFLDMKDVVGLELFDHPKSWEAIHKEVEKRLGESSAKEEDKSFFKPDYDRLKPLTFAFLKKLIESEKTEISRNNKVSTISLKGDGIIGEATTIDGKVIHLIGIKESKIVDHKSGSLTNRVTSDTIRAYTSATRGDDRWNVNII